MRQPEPNRDSEAFLSALAEQLSAPPGDLATKRHIAAAVATARAARPAGMSLQWAAAAVAVFAILGTGGIAAAGGLPAAVQGMVADVARALPLPFEIPYPDANIDEGPADRRAPEDGEVETEVFLPTTTPPEPTAEPSTVDDVRRTSHGEYGGERGDGASDDCDVSDISSDRGRLDESEWHELREHLTEECGLDFVAPPNFTNGDREDRDGGRDDRSRDDRDDSADHRGEERRDSDSDDEVRGSDEWDETDGDRQEDRHHDGGRDDDRGPGDRRGDGRDSATRYQGEDQP